MAKDHFKEHSYQKDGIDWNFNILVGEQSDVMRMANDYAPALLACEGLYDPIPLAWLHMTILRVGLTSEFTESEMDRVADVLELKLSHIQLPELIFDSWWQWGGNIVFHISPHDELSKVYDAVVEALREVVGEDRARVTPHGHFIPHVTVAYTKDHHNELATSKTLSGVHVKPAKFRAPRIALIRQWPTEGHYEWEIIRELAISSS